MIAWADPKTGPDHHGRSRVMALWRRRVKKRWGHCGGSNGIKLKGSRQMVPARHEGTMEAKPRYVMEVREVRGIRIPWCRQGTSKYGMKLGVRTICIYSTGQA